MRHRVIDFSAWSREIDHSRAQVALGAYTVRAVIASRLANFGTTIFTEMSALAERTGAINLGQGFPDEDGPQAVLEAAEVGGRAVASGGVDGHRRGLGHHGGSDILGRAPSMLDADVEHGTRHPARLLLAMPHSTPPTDPAATPEARPPAPCPLGLRERDCWFPTLSPPRDPLEESAQRRVSVVGGSG